MRIIIDTTKDCIIVPETFYDKLDATYANMAIANRDAKAKPDETDYTQFVKNAFESAIKHPLLRPSQAKKK